VHVSSVSKRITRQTTPDEIVALIIGSDLAERLA